MICLNVVEHLPDDLGALTNIRETLAPGGRAIILVPCGPKLYGTLDEVLGHQRRYTHKTLAMWWRSRFPVGTNAGVQPSRRDCVVVERTSLRRRTFGLGQIKMLNALTPVFRLLDGILPLPPLSLIAVIRKPVSWRVRAADFISPWKLLRVRVTEMSASVSLIAREH